MDVIGLEGIECSANIGVLDWERQIKQKVVIDLELQCDIAAQIQEDDVTGGVDYAAVHAAVLDKVESGSWQLIETMAEALSTMILERFPIESVKIRVTKPGILRGVKKAWVALERRRIA